MRNAASGDEETGLRTSEGLPVLVRRSARRRRTVSAFWEDGKAVVAIPASFSRRQEREWLQTMIARLESSRRRSVPKRRTDEALMTHARELSERYLQGRAVPESVRWVTNQNSRWGSATPAEKTIRLSDKLRGMPDWVVDYVLLHELAHLLVAGHGPRFWALLTAYPRTEEAKAFLAGVSFAIGRGMQDGDMRGDDLQSEDGPEEIGKLDGELGQ